MMIMIAIYDSAAQVYSTPVFVQSRGVALRSFQDLVNNKDNQYNAHPEHFSLFMLGDYDESSGLVSPSKSPLLIANAWEIVK